MRRIDADALKENVSRTALTITGMRFGKTVLREILIKYRDCVLRTIDDAPTIDAEPVKHGRWFKGIDGVYHCTRCGLEPLCWDDGTEVLSRHCPHCGTLMDGGNDE